MRTQAKKSQAERRQGDVDKYTRKLAVSARRRRSARTQFPSRRPSSRPLPAAPIPVSATVVAPAPAPIPGMVANLGRPPTGSAIGRTTKHGRRRHEPRGTASPAAAAHGHGGDGRAFAVHGARRPNPRGVRRGGGVLFHDTARSPAPTRGLLKPDAPSSAAEVVARRRSDDDARCSAPDRLMFVAHARGEAGVAVGVVPESFGRRRR